MKKHSVTAILVVTSMTGSSRRGHLEETVLTQVTFGSPYLDLKEIF